MKDHFPNPRYEERVDGKHKRNATCRTCGRPIVRRGKLMASDGQRGTWRHVKES